MATEPFSEAPPLSENKMADRPAKKSRLRQYITAIVVNVTSIINGIGIGWTSPVTPLLKSDGNPVSGSAMTDTTVSWLGSVSFIAALASLPVLALVSKHYSRKTVGYVVGMLGLLGWSLILFARSEIVLICGRFCLGFLGSGSNVLCSIYIAETVDDDVRGFLGSFLSMFISGGILFSYVCGSYLPYTTFNIVCSAVPAIFLMAFWWMPESPLYLESKGLYFKAQKVRESLNMKYNSPDSDCDSEHDKNEVPAENKTFFNELIHNRGTRKALVIGLGVMACNQLSGVMAVLSYTVTIFQESGSELSPNTATILVGALPIVGTYISSFLVDRLGRKILLIASSIIAATCLGALSLYFSLRNQKFDVSSFGWVPVTSLCLYMIGLSFGVGSVPFIIIGEIFTPRVKSIAIPLCISMGTLVALLVSRFYMSMTKAFGLGGSYLFFAVLCLISAAFCHFVVPETKNKSLEAILMELNREKPKKRAVKSFAV